MDAKARARKGLLVYLAALVPLAGAVEVAIFRAGGSIDDHPLLVGALMWTPALASLFARLVLKERPADVSFRLGKRKAWAYLVAWLFPVAIGLMAYGTAWATGLAELGIPALKPNAAVSDPVVRFALKLVIQLTLGVLVGAVFAAGEEIGWRGYMLTRLVDAGVPRPILLSAVIWGLWHAPLILSGQYASSGSPVLSTAIFMVDVVAFTYLVSRLRLETGSVWPAVLAHAAWNAVIQGVFDHWTAKPSLWVGESGILTALFDLALVFLLVRGRWTLRRTPADEQKDVPALATF